MTDFWLTEWLDDPMIAGEPMTDKNEIRNHLLAHIADNLKILNKTLEKIATVLENEYERHNSM